MPELPEVETIKRGLEELIVGAEIVEVEVRLPKIIRGELQHLKGAKIQSIRRRGKGLLIDLDSGYSLAIHVKMTGQLIYQRVSRVSKVSKARKKVLVKNLHPKIVAPPELPSKHTHVIFKLKVKNEKLKIREEKEAYLYYNDIRQFGWLHLVRTNEAEQLPFFRSLGPEPLRDLTLEQFNTIVSSAKAPIKQVLMDQSRLAGVGNIYANDALFHAGIHPLRPANSLSAGERKKLFHAVAFVLTEGIKAGGASENTFLNALGEKGFYQERFLVYSRTGQACSRCGTPIQRIVVGGRGTFFCPECQPF